MSQRGFTLVELIVVIIMIGIMAVVIAPRFADNDVFLSRGSADQVKAALRYGQKVAVAQNRNVTVTIGSAAGTDPDCGTTLTNGNVNCLISSQVSVTGASVTFDSGGRPNAAASFVVGEGLKKTTITVEAETGYVH